MREMCLRTLVAVAILTPSITFGQSGTPNFSITNYQFVSEERVTLTKSNVTYRADIVNPGAAQASVSAKLTSLNPNSFQPVQGKDTLNFAPVPANSQVTSSNTFTILVDRSVPFSFKDIQWTFNGVPQAPVANAGPNQSATVGSVVTLNGTGSTNPSGIGTLTYSWAFTSRPGGSTATLSNPTSSMPTFIPDVPGSYVIALTVSNGAGSDTASVMVSTNKPPAPVANAGADQKAKVGATVFLNGAGSTSGSGNPLTYSWTLITRPAGSTATLSGANTVSPTFVMDKAGTYQAQLIVNDGIASSTPSIVTITTDIVKPVANAGPDQLVNAGNLVQLNGAGSTDANGLPLTYKWSLIALPPNSQATLNLPNSVNPTFTADVPGTYTAQLIVNNGTFDSTPSTVNITTHPPLKPTANAGPNQTVNGGGTIVTLNGSGTDPQNLPLTFHWLLINKPQGSAATLSSATIPNPTFSADLAGTYVAQLIVNNGFMDSDPSTVTISTTCAPPTANAGPNQTVIVGTSVSLDGSASGDACRDPLTYAWSFVTRPAGSAAALFGATTASPTFLPDVPGTYVVQLIVNNGVNPSTPATVTITVNPKPTITLTPNPLSASTAPVTLTVTLSAAPASGQVINLVSGDTSIATVPATVTVPAGATSATVQVTPGALGSTTITASANNYVSGTTTVTVANLVISVPPTTSVNLGQSQPFAVTLAAPAPAPVTVTLTSSDPTKVTVPGTVSIAAGATAPAVQPQVTGAGIGSATITASAPGYASGTGTVTVPAPTMNFSGSPLSLTVGNTSHLTLTLTGGVAPAGGLAVTLTSSDPSKATVPSTVNFAAGASTTTVPVTGVAAGSTTITASAAGIAPATATATVTSDIILPANLTIQPGQQVDYNVALANPAPNGGVLITLTIADSSVVSLVPVNVLIPQGQTQPSRMPQLTGLKAGSTTITASAFGFHSTTQSVQVTQAATISFSPNTISFSAPGTQNLTLNLSTPAPTGGLTVNVSSDNPAVATTPAAVTFAQGTQSVGVPVTAVAAGTTTIRASALPTIPETTASVTVAGGKSISVASTSVGLGLQANLQVALAQAAPAGGVTLTLTSSDPSKVTVPGSVIIPAGQTVPAVLPQVTGAGIGSAIITASAPGYSSGTGTVTVSATMAFTGSPLSVAAGSTGNLTLNLNGGQAPAGGLTVALTSSDATKATVPATVTIAAGASSATVPVTGVAAGGPVTITASVPGIPNAVATVNVTQLAITVQDTTVGLGLSAPLTVTLLQPAPAGGLTVNLASSDTTKVTVPATVSIPAGASTAPVQVTGAGIGTANITATASGYTAGTGKVTVTAPTMSFSPANLSVGIGATNNLTLTLAGGQAPSGGLTVNLSSSDTSKATVPATVTFAAGASSANVTVTGVAAGSATITASAPGLANATAAVTVTSGVDIILPFLTIQAGQTVPLQVSLANPAPAGGVLISLSIADTSVASLVQTNVSIPAGATQPLNPPQVNGLKAGSTTITASSFGFKSATQTLQVTPPLTLSFSPTSLTLNGNGTLTLNLSAAAPAGGLTVSLSSSNPSAGTVPATATFAQGTQSVTVPVTAVGNGTTTIHASALPGIADTTATVTFVLQSVQVPATTSVNLGQSTDFAVNLSKPAPAGGVTVNLVSSDPSKVTVPASVAIAAGATTPAVQPQVTGAGIGSATITASASGYGSATGTVTVPAPGMAFSGSPLTVLAGASGNLTLNLTGGKAPAGGLTVTLSSNNTGVATVPPSVTFAAGSTSVTVPATGVSQGTATITATAPGIAPATATVNVTVIVLPTIMVPVTTSLPLGQSVPFAVSVSAAPASDLTIALASDNPAVTLSAPTVVIPAGQTTPAVQPQITGAAIGSAHITASASGYTQGVGAVTVPAPSLKFAGNLTLVAGAQGNLTLNLTGGQAPAGGLTVNLNSDNTSAATVPATISFPAGATSVLVPVTAGLVQSTQTANITASASGIAPASAVVTVNPAGGISVSSATVGTNQSATLTITLPAPAAAGGVSVALSSSDSSKATVPASVTIAAGATSTTATVNGLSAGTVTITAAAPGFGTGTGSVTVTPLVLTASDVTVTSGAQGTLTLTLTGGQAPSGGLTVNLTSDNTGVATVAPTATFAAGATTATAQVTGGSVTAQQTANITATAPGGLSATSKVTVTPLPTITVAPVSLGLGQSADLQITLAQAAPSDLTVTLASSDATKVGLSATTVTILKGATSPATAPQVTGLGIGSANITASAPGYAAGTGAVTVTAPTMTFTPTPLTVNPGSTGTLTLTLTGGQAPPGGLSVNLSSSATGVATVPATATFAAGATTTTVTVTGVAGGTATITASAPNMADATATVNVPIQINVQNTSVTLGGSANLQITLAQAAASDVTINLASSDASKVAVSPATITILKGATSPATAPQVTGLIAGATATITASATGFLSGSGTVTVTPPAAALTGPASISVSSTPVNFVLTLTGGKAPPAGLTFTLSSSDGTKATVPTTVTIPAGGTTANVPVTGVAAGGPVTITASAPGIANATATFNVVNLALSLPANTPVGLGQTAPLTVTVSQAPSSNLTVTLASSSSAIAAVPATVVIPAGATSAQTTVTGNGVGSATITASASGYTAGTGNVTVSVGLSIAPPSLTITGAPNTGTLTISLTGGQAPASGFSVSLNSSNTGIATVPPSVSFPAGTTSANVTVTSVSVGGPVTITASAPGVTPATASVTVAPATCTGCPTFTVPNASVGQNLQTAVVASLGQPAGPGGVDIKVTSSDASKVLVSSNQLLAGAQSVTIHANQGDTSVGFIVQGLDKTGTATVTVSAPGYLSGTGTITLTPSGFLISGPLGASSFTTNAGAPATTLTLNAARLDSSLNFVEFQEVRAGTTASVVITSSTPSVGTASSPVVFAGGDNTGTSQFTPDKNNAGTTVLTAVAPAGFSTPASGGSVTAIVQQAGISCGPVTVGLNLETIETCSLQGGQAASGQAVTITSSDTSKFLLAPSADGATCTGAGAGSITINTVGSQNIVIPPFCVYGTSKSGSATFTVQTAGFASGTGTVTLGPSGIIIAGPTGIGAPNFFALNPSTPINVVSALLDASGNYVSTQALAGGQSASVNVTSADTNVGTISTSPVTIAGGSAVATTQFVKGNPGSTVLSVSTPGSPAGFSTPAAQFRTVTATVPRRSINLSAPPFVGQNLETQGSVSVLDAAPAGGLPITLTSKDPSQLLLSTSATGAGSASITVTIPAGSTTATYFVQSPGGIVTHNLTLQNNTPTSGSISWGAFSITYQGNTFNIAAGSTSSPFAVWSPGSSTLSGVSTFNSSVFLIAANTGGVASIGSSFDASSPGFDTPPSAQVQVVPSGIVFSSQPFLFATVGTPVPVPVFTAALDPTSGNFLETEALRGGVPTLQVSLNSSNPSAGTISSPVSIAAGSNQGTAQFTPLASGQQTTITATTPPGFTTPNNRKSVQVFVQ